MATEVRHRRGTSAQLAAATPAQSEIIHNVETNTLHVGDGVTLGGHPLAKASEVARVSAANFDTRASVLSFNIPASVSHIRTAGYSAPGDGGGALYRRRPVIETDGYGDITSSDGARWAIVADSELDIRQFGGRLNDDSFDNAAILEQVLKLGAVSIPSNATITCLSSVDISNTDVSILGKSQSTSHLKFVGSVNGFIGTHSIPAAGKPIPILILDNMALVTTNDPAAAQNTAINVTYPEGFFAARFMLFGSATRCAFRGLNTEQDGWGTVVRSDNMLNFAFTECYFNGKDEGGALDQAPSKKKRSLYGVYMSGGWVPCEVRFTNCQFYHFNECIYTTGSYEGLSVTDCAFISVGTGIRQVATTFSPNWPDGGDVPKSAVGRPFITVKGTHMNVYDKGIHSFGVVQGIVEGGRFISLITPLVLRT